MVRDEDDIINFVKEMLVKRFDDEPGKHDVHKHNKGLKFSCPYCGDSQKDASKKRGILYYKTKTFKCNNDGCDMFATMRSFISKWASECDIDISEYDFDFTPEIEVSQVKFDIGTNTLADHLRSGGFLESLLVIDYFIERFSLKSVNYAAENSQVRRFITKRRLYDTPSCNDCLYFDSFDNKIVIFNYDKISRKVLGYAIRYIGESNRMLKYDLYNSTRIREHFHLEEDVPDIAALDTIANYFNIMNVDFKKNVSMLEGQFDSMFVRNAIAVSGVNKLDFLLKYINKQHTNILLDNDKAGRKESFDTLRKSFNTFLWGKLVYNLRRRLPDSIADISRMKDINDFYCFLGNKTDVNFDTFNDLLERYYSNSPYDLMYL